MLAQSPGSFVEYPEERLLVALPPVEHIEVR